MRWAILVLMLASVAAGQVSPDEAARRLKEKQAAREAERAQEVTITRGELDDLHAEVQRLTAEVASLQKQIEAQKQAKHPALSPAKTKPQAPRDATKVNFDLVKKGMTFDEAVKLFGIPARQSRDAEGRVVARWFHEQPLGSVKGFATGGGYDRRLTATFDDGKLVEFADEKGGFGNSGEFQSR